MCVSLVQAGLGQRWSDGENARKGRLLRAELYCIGEWVEAGAGEQLALNDGQMGASLLLAALLFSIPLAIQGSTSLGPTMLVGFWLFLVAACILSAIPATAAFSGIARAPQMGGNCCVLHGQS